MDIFFAPLAFLFMLCFLSTIRAFINKEEEKQTVLVLVTSAIFGALFWICMVIWAG